MPLPRTSTSVERRCGSIERSTQNQAASLTQAIERAAGREIGHHQVGVRIPERIGDLVLVVENQAVARSSCEPMELDACAKQHLVGVEDRLVDADVGEHACRLCPAERMDVAKTAATVLEIGAEDEGDLAVLLMCIVEPLGESNRVVDRVFAPLFSGGHRELKGELLGADEAACREECRGGVEVGSGDLQQPVDRVDSMAELQACVPDRIPDLLGELLEVGVGRVYEDDVEIAVRRHLLAAVSSDRDQRHPVGYPGFLGDGHDPVVEPLRVRSSEVRTSQGRIGQEIVAFEQHSSIQADADSRRVSGAAATGGASGAGVPSPHPR